MCSKFNKFIYQEGSLEKINTILSDKRRINIVDVWDNSKFELDEEAKEVLKDHYLNKAIELNRHKYSSKTEILSKPVSEILHDFNIPIQNNKGEFRSVKDILRDLILSVDKLDNGKTKAM